MTRAALLCTILTSKKHADGISKLVYEADLDKMKGALKEKTVKMEQLLREGWKQVQQHKGSEAIKGLMFWEAVQQIGLAPLVQGEAFQGTCL